MTQYRAKTRVAPHLAMASVAAMAAMLAACATDPRYANCPAGARYAVECASAAAAAAPAAPVSSAPVTTPDPMASEPRSLEPIRNLEAARAAAPDMGLKTDAPLRYVVKKGDTLWAISNRYLADAWQWPELWYVNGKVKNPHLIYPGDVLELRYLNGRPQLVRDDSELERLSPRIRELALEDALPAIPVEAIRNFLRGPRLVDLDTLNKAPYLLAFTDEHIIGASNEGIYIKNLQKEQGTAFSVVRRGDAYKDPDTGELLGYEAVPAGEAEVHQFGAPSEGVLTKSFHEILPGDRLLPFEADNYQANFYPHAPAKPVGGRILSVYEGVSQITQYQIVAMNRGSNQGLEVGHVLSVLQARRKIADPVTGKSELLPEQEAGLLMVFKVMPRVSYGLVMTASRPVHVMDKVEKPDLTRKR